MNEPGARHSAGRSSPGTVPCVLLSSGGFCRLRLRIGAAVAACHRQGIDVTGYGCKFSADPAEVSLVGNLDLQPGAIAISSDHGDFLTFLQFAQRCSCTSGTLADVENICGGRFELL